MLAELASIEHICDGIDDAVNERSYEEYWETKSRVRDDAEIAERMGRIQKRFSDDYLILTDEFIKIFDELTGEMRGDPYNTSPPDEHEIFSPPIRKHRPRLMAIPRDEL